MQLEALPTMSHFISVAMLLHILRCGMNSLQKLFIILGLYTENHEFALLAHRSKHRIIQKKIDDPNIKNTGVVIPAFSDILPHDDFWEGIASQ